MPIQIPDSLKSILAVAAYEARVAKHNFVGTNHLLLAMLRQPDSAALIAEFGLDPLAVWTITEQCNIPIDNYYWKGPRPFSPQCRVALQRAIAAAAPKEPSSSDLLRAMLSIEDSVVRAVIVKRSSSDR